MRSSQYGCVRDREPCIERGGMSFVAPDGLVPEAPYELVRTTTRLGAALGHAAGPLRPRQGVAARRLRDRLAPRGSAASAALPCHGRHHHRGKRGYMHAGLPEGWKRLKGARITTDMVTA